MLSRSAPLEPPCIREDRYSNIQRTIVQCTCIMLLACMLASCGTTRAIQTTNQSTHDAAESNITAPDSISSAPIDEPSIETEEMTDTQGLETVTDITITLSDVSPTGVQHPPIKPTQEKIKTVAEKAPKTRVEPSQPMPLNKYTVKDGENLYTIAQHPFIYAEGMLWPLIYRANRDQIKNPRQIYPGQTLTVPREVSEADIEQARTRAVESQIFSTSEHK